MIIKVYENDAFKRHSRYDQRMVICEHRIIEDDSFEHFTKECMLKEMLIDSFYELNLISNRREVKKIVDKEYKDAVESIEFDILYELWDMLDDAVYDTKIKHPKNLKQALRIYDHEWNYFFYVIETEDRFYAYIWNAKL